MWRPNFKEKLCSQQKLFFWLVKNSFFHFSNIPGRDNSLSVKWKRIFNDFFIPASGNGFSVQWRKYFFIQSFVEAFEIRRWQLLLVETDFLAIRTYFFPFLRYSFQRKLFSIQWKHFFKRILQSVWWRLISYLIFFLQVETVTETSGTHFLGKDFFPASRKRFSVY